MLSQSAPGTGGGVFKPAAVSSLPKQLPFAALRVARRAVVDPLFSLLMPAQCRICERPVESLTRVPICDACWDAVLPYEGLECAQCGMFLEQPVALHGTPFCRLCRRDAFVFAQARSFGWYDGALRGLIQRFKYNGFRPLAKPLGGYLRETLRRLNETAFDLILAVPLHRNRERQRGFNQAGLLAARLSKLTGVPVGRKDCVRVRDTRPQTGLRGAARRKNVAGAFAVPHPERVGGLRVLLVDDVLTTGATVDACSRALMKAGAAGVWALTLARARPGSADVL